MKLAASQLHLLDGIQAKIQVQEAIVQKLCAELVTLQAKVTEARQDQQRLETFRDRCLDEYRKNKTRAEEREIEESNIK